MSVNVYRFILVSKWYQWLCELSDCIIQSSSFNIYININKNINMTENDKDCQAWRDSM